MSTIKERIAAEAAATEEAEIMVDDHAPLPEGTVVTRGHGRSKVLQVRLNGDELEQLELLAKGRELPVSTLARSLILAALAPTDDAGAALTRIETDVAALRRAMTQA